MCLIGFIDFPAVFYTNIEFIKWIKLRLGYFENIDKDEKLREDLKSDGICGVLRNDINNNVLEHYPNFLHPDILISQYKNNLKLYYQYNS